MNVEEKVNSTQVAVSPVVQPIQEFEAKVDALAREKSEEIVFNADTQHALSIVRALFRYGRKSISILSEKLDESVYSDPDLIKSATGFLAAGGTLRIMVQKDANLVLNKPFMQSIKEYRERVTLKSVGKENPFHGVDKNFIVMDDGAYRFETNTTLHQATCCFNDAKLTKELQGLFDSCFVMPSATAVTLS